MLYGFIVGIVVSIIGYFLNKKGDKEAQEIQNNTYRDEMKKMIEKREEISITDIKDIEEDEFWQVLEKNNKRAQNSYRNQIGLLKDYFLEKDENFILGFYSFYRKTMVNNSNFRIIGAFQIINNSRIFIDYSHFLSWLISRGRVLFNNAVNNPELICNIEIKDLSEITLEDLLIDCYISKTNKMFPKLTDFNIDQESDEEIPMEKLFGEFPLLWKKFIRLHQ